MLWLCARWINLRKILLHVCLKVIFRLNSLIWKYYVFICYSNISNSIMVYKLHLQSLIGVQHEWIELDPTWRWVRLGMVYYQLDWLGLINANPNLIWVGHVRRSGATQTQFWLYIYIYKSVCWTLNQYRINKQIVNFVFVELCGVLLF